MSLLLADIVRVTIVGRPTPINLSADLFWKASDDSSEIDDQDPTQKVVKAKTYVKLVKAKSEINRVPGVPMLAKGKNSIETLTRIRKDDRDVERHT